MGVVGVAVALNCRPEDESPPVRRHRPRPWAGQAAPPHPSSRLGEATPIGPVCWKEHFPCARTEMVTDRSQKQEGAGGAWGRTVLRPGHGGQALRTGQSTGRRAPGAGATLCTGSALSGCHSRCRPRQGGDLGPEPQARVLTPGSGCGRVRGGDASSVVVATGGRKLPGGRRREQRWRPRVAGPLTRWGFLRPAPRGGRTSPHIQRQPSAAAFTLQL